jgi:hypothetical protein
MRRDIEMVKKLRNLSLEEEPSGLRLEIESEPKVWSAA